MFQASLTWSNALTGAGGTCARTGRTLHRRVGAYQWHDAGMQARFRVLTGTFDFQEFEKVLKNEVRSKRRGFRIGTDAGGDSGILDDLAAAGRPLNVAQSLV